MTNDSNGSDAAESREGEDPGLLGGGGPAGTIYGDDDTLDERGEDMTRVDEGAD
jgi:hypothetical protein